MLVHSKRTGVDGTYERKTAVPAGCNLGLVGVDEDLRVAKGTAAAVTADNLGLCPPHGLLVNELDGGHGLRLHIRGQFCSVPLDQNQLFWLRLTINPPEDA